jgi:hypothetical protein
MSHEDKLDLASIWAEARDVGRFLRTLHVISLSSMSMPNLNPTSGSFTSGCLQKWSLGEQELTHVLVMNKAGVFIADSITPSLLVHTELQPLKNPPQ